MGRTDCTEPQCLYSTAIPVLPLWAVPPVQSLSACTVQLYLYSPYGPYGHTEPQCLYSIAIPLLPYGPYGLYRASVPVQYSYTSTPSVGRTACTEPQCLYKGALYLLPSKYLCINISWRRRRSLRPFWSSYRRDELEGTWKETVALKFEDLPSNLTWDSLLPKKITVSKMVGIKISTRKREVLINTWRVFDITVGKVIRTFCIGHVLQKI